MQTVTKTERRKKKEEAKVIDYKQTAYEFNSDLEEGNYIVPFDMVLP